MAGSPGWIATRRWHSSQSCCGATSLPRKRSADAWPKPCCRTCRRSTTATTTPGATSHSIGQAHGFRAVMTAYPRDMIGYGAAPPHAQWPDDARIAVQFGTNCEEGGENSILPADPAAKSFLSEVIGAQPVLGMRNLNMESLYEYGSRAGFWRLYRAFTERGLPVTVYAVAMALDRNREATAA